MKDQQWREKFVIELRLMEVPGAKVGDELKLVEEHLAQSGESAYDAFGDPVTYVRDLGYTHKTSSWGSLIVIALMGYLSVSLLGDGVVALVGDKEVVVGGGDIVGAALAVLTSCTLLFLLARVRRPWVMFGGLWVVTITASILIENAWNPTVVSMSGWVSVGIAAVLIVVLFVILRRTVRANRVADPLTGEDMMSRKYVRSAASE